MSRRKDARRALLLFVCSAVLMTGSQHLLYGTGTATGDDAIDRLTMDQLDRSRKSEGTGGDSSTQRARRIHAAYRLRMGT